MNVKQINENVGKVAVLMRDSAVRHIILGAMFRDDKRLAKRVDRYLANNINEEKM